MQKIIFSHFQSIQLSKGSCEKNYFNFQVFLECADPAFLTHSSSYFSSRLITNNSWELKFVYLFERFQTFVGINVTGELDETTLQWMNKPRCGVKDVSNLYHDSAEPYQVIFSEGRKFATRFINFTCSRS